MIIIKQDAEAKKEKKKNLLKQFKCKVGDYMENILKQEQQTLDLVDKNIDKND